MTAFHKTKPLGLCDALLGEEGSVLALQLTSMMQAETAPTGVSWLLAPCALHQLQTNDPWQVRERASTQGQLLSREV